MKPVSIRILRLFWKHKLTILVGALTTLTTVALGLLSAVPSYQATSQILVRFGREYIYQHPSAERPSNYTPNMATITNAEAQILASREVYENVARTIGPANLYADLQDSEADIIEARKRIAQGVAVKATPETGIIEISFRHPDRRIAATVVNEVVASFKKKHLKTFIDPQNLPLLQQQTEAYQKKLQESEERLQQLKLQHQAYSLEEQRTLFLRQRSDLDSELKKSQNHTAELYSKLRSYEDQMLSFKQNSGSPFRRSPGLEQVQQRLLELRLKEAELGTKYADTSPQVIEVRKQIATVESTLAAQQQQATESASASDPLYIELQQQIMRTRAEYVASQTRTAGLRRHLTQLDSSLQNQVTPETLIRTLEREVAANEENYNRSSLKLEQARATQDMNDRMVTSISVIQPAAPPQQPDQLHRSLNLLLSCLVGAFVGIGMALFTEYRHIARAAASTRLSRLPRPGVTTVDAFIGRYNAAKWDPKVTN